MASVSRRKSKREDELPFLVLVQGPPKCGKTLLIKALLKHFTENLMPISGGQILVRSKLRRIHLVECKNEINGLIDGAKLSDLTILLVNCNQGLEKETVEFLTMLKVHGYPKVLGVLTHLDNFNNLIEVKDRIKQIKKGFCDEFYHDAEFFPLSGVQDGMYHDDEIHNLSERINNIEFPYLSWRTVNPYLLIDRFEIITGPGKLNSSQNINFYGYVRGCSIKKGAKVHIAGVGDYPLINLESLPDPFPFIDNDLKKESIFHAPMSGLGDILNEDDPVCKKENVPEDKDFGALLVKLLQNAECPQESDGEGYDNSDSETDSDGEGYDNSDSETVSDGEGYHHSHESNFHEDEYPRLEFHIHDGKIKNRVIFAEDDDQDFNNAEEEKELVSDIDEYKKGTYVRLEVHCVPLKIVESFDPCQPILLSGTKENETVGLVQVRLQSHRWSGTSPKSLDPIIISVGWRRYITIPVYGEIYGLNGPVMLEHIPEGRPCFAVFWGPIGPADTGVVAVQNRRNNQTGFRITATGSILEYNPSKKITREIRIFVSEEIFMKKWIAVDVPQVYIPLTMAPIETIHPKGKA